MQRMFYLLCLVLLLLMIVMNRDWVLRWSKDAKIQTMLEHLGHFSPFNMKVNHFMHIATQCRHVTCCLPVLEERSLDLE